MNYTICAKIIGGDVFEWTIYAPTKWQATLIFCRQLRLKPSWLMFCYM